MDRRQILTMTATAATLAALPTARAAEATGHHHEPVGPFKALFESADGCVRTGLLCQAHCQTLLAGGDRSIADCSKSVDALLPVCQTLAALAAQGSVFLPRYAKLAGDVCRACEKECRKHVKEHEQCRDCAEACARCAKNCDSVAA